MVRMRTVLASALVAVVATAGLVAPVAALGTTDQSVMEREKQETQKTEAQKQAVRDAAKARVQGRLDEAKKKVCAARTAAIGKIMSRAAEMGQKHLAVFSTIYNRVVDFYAAKKLNVTNYDALKAAAQAKYEVATAAVKMVKDSPALDCNGENPVGAAEQFKAKVVQMHAALKDYRSAINALLVAVKTAAGAEGGAQ